MKIRSLRNDFTLIRTLRSKNLDSVNGFTLIRTLRSKNLIRVQSAFTLIELLVVISIIGILAAVVTVSFTSAQKQARDTQRKSDLAQYRTSLEMYANKNNGLYPAGATGLVTECISYSLSGVCPEDPKCVSDPGCYHYQYRGFVGTKYALVSKLENAASKYWLVCSGGASLTITGSEPDITNCP